MTPLRLAGCLIPLFVALAFKDRSTLSILAIAAVQALYVASWDVVGGLSGRPSLGHALPFGCAAYVAAYVSMWSIVPPPVALAAGALAGVGAGALQGTLGAPGPGGLLFGGDGGLPAAVFPPGEADAARLAAAVLAVTLILLLWVAHTPLGLAMRTARADDRLAAASGIDVARVRFLSFAIAGGAAGAAGAFAATIAGRATPAALSLDLSLFAAAIAGMGGPGTIVGPALTAYAASLALQWLGPPPALRLTVYALVLTGVVLARPRRLRREGPPRRAVFLWMQAEGARRA